MHKKQNSCGLNNTPKRVVVFLFILFIAATYADDCYSGYTIADTTTNLTTVPIGISVCARYDYGCTTGDETCSDAEISAKTCKHAYVVTTQDTCNQIAKAHTSYLNVYCCSTDLCNTPTGTDPCVVQYNSAPMLPISTFLLMTTVILTTFL